jgi:hypothetical protein
MGAARVCTLLPPSTTCRELMSCLGQRRNRLHRQRHRATRQLPAPTPPPHPLPRAKPRLEYPGEPLDEHTESQDAGPHEEPTL